MSTDGKNIFFINPDNWDFAANQQRAHLPSGLVGGAGFAIILAITVGTFMLSVGFIYPSTNGKYADPIILLMALGLYTIAARILFSVSRLYVVTKRLEHNGRLIQGEIVEAKGDMDDENGSYSYVSVVYRFRSPVNNEYKTGKTTRHYPSNLRYCVLPSSGMPVYVLYLDDNIHRML